MQGVAIHMLDATIKLAAATDALLLFGALVVEPHLQKSQSGDANTTNFNTQASSTPAEASPNFLLTLARKTNHFNTSNPRIPTTQAKVPVQGHYPIQAIVVETCPAPATLGTCPALGQCPIQDEVGGTCPASDQSPIDDGMTGTCPAPAAGYWVRAYDAATSVASYAAPYALPLLGTAVLASALYAAYGLYSARQEELAAKSAREAFEGRIADLGLVSMNKAANALGGLAGQFASRARFVLAIIANLAGILINAGRVVAATTVAAATIGHKSVFGGIRKNVARLSLSAANTGVAAAGVAIPELARLALEDEYKLAGIEANRANRAIYAAAG